MNIWLSLSIYLTLLSVGLFGGAMVGVAAGRALGVGPDPGWALGALLGGLAGLWLARRVCGQWGEKA